MSRRPASTKYSNVTNDVIRSRKVTDAVEKAAHDEYEEIFNSSSVPNADKTMPVLRDKHKRRAISILQKMKSVISAGLLRIAGWVLYKVLGKMLTTVQFSKGQMALLKRVHENTKMPIIYLPVHRSHLDYILVSFILYMNNIKPPLVAAGDNLNIPFFGNLMRGLGAFFIKRKLDPKSGKKDYVYRAVLSEYMAENIQRGESIEFFLEGGRSRSGKTCMPKGGLLSIVVNTLVDNHIENAYIVPVSISYEKLIDGNFVAEQLGKPKVSESFSLAVRAIWKTLRSNYGSVRVDFCKPFSLKEYVRAVSFTPYSSIDEKGHKNCTARLPCPACATKISTMRTVSSTTSMYGTDELGPEDKRDIVRQLGEHVLYDAQTNAALMSTQLLSFLLLTQFRKGATMQQLVPKMNWLREELTSRHRNIGFSGDTADAIRYASNLLGRNLVSTEIVQMAWSSSESSDDSANRVKKIVRLKPSPKLHALIELQYYSNNVLSVFLYESLLGKNDYNDYYV